MSVARYTSVVKFFLQASAARKVGLPRGSRAIRCGEERTLHHGVCSSFFTPDQPKTTLSYFDDVAIIDDGRQRREEESERTKMIMLGVADSYQLSLDPGSGPGTLILRDPSKKDQNHSKRAHPCRFVLSRSNLPGIKPFWVSRHPDSATLASGRGLKKPFKLGVARLSNDNCDNRNAQSLEASSWTSSGLETINNGQQFLLVVCLYRKTFS